MTKIKQISQDMKKLTTQKQIFLLFMLSLLTSFTFIRATYEEEPTEKKKIKAICLFNGKAAAINQAIGKSDTEISLKLFPFDEEDRKAKKELVVQEFEVFLMRDGQKIASQTIFGNGSISQLAALAKNEDIYQIQLKEVFERTADGNLRPYTKGSMKLNYLFFDLKPFKDQVQLQMQETTPKEEASKN